jgi:hypothetical protein
MAVTLSPHRNQLQKLDADHLDFAAPAFKSAEGPLAPFESNVDGQAQTNGGAKPLSVLAALGLDPNRY